jgi:hypothetical protein
MLTVRLQQDVMKRDCTVVTITKEITVSDYSDLCQQRTLFVEELQNLSTERGFVVMVDYNDWETIQ